MVQATAYTDPSSLGYINEVVEAALSAPIWVLTGCSHLCDGALPVKRLLPPFRIACGQPLVLQGRGIAPRTEPADNKVQPWHPARILNIKKGEKK